MASCSGNGSNNSTYQLVLTVTQGTQDIQNNETNVNWELVLNSTGSYSFSDWGSTCSVNIAGETVYNNWSQKSISAGGSITIASGSKTIKHNDDGTKSINFSASYSEGSIAYFTAGSINCSGSMTLTTIPRASSISGGSGAIGNTTTITINRASASFTHTLTYSFGTLAGTIVTKTTSTSVNWTIPTSFYNIIPNSNSGTGTITCTTYNGNTIIGNPKTLTFTATVTNANPTFSNFTFQDTNTTVTNVTGNNQIMVKGLSTLVATISSANKMVAIKGASASKYVASIDTQTLNANYSTSDVVFNFDPITASGIQRLSIRAYDSRNNSTLVYKDVEIVDYEMPVINATATRLNNFEATTTITASINFSPVTINGVVKNYMDSVKYRYRVKNGSWGSYTNISYTTSGTTAKCTDVILTLDNTQSYEIEISASDRFSTSTEILTIDVGQAIFFISSNKKECYINDQKVLTVNDLYEVGDLLLTTNTINPSTRFGGTWELVAKGRTLVGVDTNDSDFNTVKKTGGEKTHKLTVNEMPSHSHNTTYEGSNKSVMVDTGLNDNAWGLHWETKSGYRASYGAISNTGGGQAHNNLQPYFTCYIWCRTA